MDLLPLPPDEAPVQQLHVYYFELADLMFGHYLKLSELLEKKGRLSKANVRKFQQYAQLWLATLYVVAEAFYKDEHLQRYFEACKDYCPESSMHWSCIQHQIGQLGDELRVFRNFTFHFQLSTAKRRHFLEHSGPRRPIQWARAIHEEMQMFFAHYRVEGTALFYHRKWTSENAVRAS
jgi:hypothetical protein